MALPHPRRPDDEPELMLDINTTPLIDVMLVLLIMLIITIPIQTHSVQLDLPNGQPPALQTPPPVVVLDVNADDSLLWNGQRIAGRSDLEARLKAVVAQGNQAEIHLRPNRAATYAPVAMVLSTAQRLGITKLGIVGHEQFGEH
ncbi:MAG: biopolymer transporter ExbD [Betaproteobacteria bacterium]|nr:biopolymer transporter ExbD [Betaproteobacteria bacterium]